MSRIRTNPVRVKLYTADYIFSGMMHTKPGGYKERVSDILNDPTGRFVVLTDVTFRPAHDESAPARRSPTAIVKIEEIKFLIPFETEPRDETRSGPAESLSQSW